MWYKEWLRARRAIIIMFITAGVLLVVHFLYHALTGTLAGEPASRTPNRESDVPLSLFFAFAGVVAAIFAGVFGGSLSDENDGHLALAWTKPVSRTDYALATIAVDLAFVAFVFVFTFGFFAANQIAHLGANGNVVVDRDAWWNLARFTLLAVAWYGVAQALTASLKQHSGTVRGVSVAVAAIFLAFGAADLPQPWHALVQLINYVNPLAYASYQYPNPQPLYPFQTVALDVTALIAIGVAGVVAALWQWRRLEA